MSMLWRHEKPLVLASTSATRRLLLESAGLSPHCVRPEVDERVIEADARTAGIDSTGLAVALARAKALDGSRQRPGHIVIGADQVLACEGQLFHKPASRNEAASQIAALSGREHRLHSGVAIAQDGQIVDSFCDDAVMTMRDLGPAAIALYLDLAGDDVCASVGGYRLEGAGVHLFSDIAGAHATILGLPLLPLLASLRRLGVLAL